MTRSSKAKPPSAIVSSLLAALLIFAVGLERSFAAPTPTARIGGDRVLAVYLPSDELAARLFLPQISAAVAPIQAIEDAVDAGKVHFRSAFSLNEDADQSFNAVLVLHPKWDGKDGQSTLAVQYKVLDATGASIIEGTKTDSINTGKLLVNNSFYTVALGIMKDIFSADAMQSAFSNPQAHLAQATRGSFDPALLVSRDKPIKSGTGFYINERGQVMTAAHVIHDCPVRVVKVEGKPTDTKLLAESLLLDLAVLDSGTTPPHSLPLRSGTAYDLGEGVTNIGFPLEGVLAGSANVTRGNISSRSALAGSLGQFQFSAPVQPGSSGGPVVSETGELLGVTVGTLAVNGLIQKGVLPQNVNFALDAHYVASFLDRYKIQYASVPAHQKSDTRSATELALPAVVQVICYE